MGEQQQRAMVEVAGEEGRYHGPEGLSVEHCNDVNRVPRDKSEVLT